MKEIMNFSPSLGYNMSKTRQSQNLNLIWSYKPDIRD